MNEIDQKHQEVLGLLAHVEETVGNNKPNDRSKSDRAYAIFLSYLQKAMAYYYVYIASQQEEN